MKSRAWTWSLGGTLAVLLASQVAQATIIVPRSLPEMATESSAVVRAKVVQRQAAWDSDHRRIHTYTELQVLETVHEAKALPATIVVRTMGGEVGDIGMRVAGVARFEVGEEVLLFLRDDPMQANHFQVIGMSQGKYRIDRSGPSVLAVPSVEGLAFATRDATGKMKVGEGGAVNLTAVPLVDLIAQVKASLRTAAATPTAPSGPSAPTVPTAPTVVPQSGDK